MQTHQEGGSSHGTPRLVTVMTPRVLKAIFRLSLLTASIMLAKCKPEQQDVNQSLGNFLFMHVSPTPSGTLPHI